MNLIIEQGKQYFQGKDYTKALKIIEDHQAQIPEQKLAFAYDIAGCSCFMLKNYDAANNYFNQCLHKNPKVVNFYISKGATLRNLNNQTEAIQILQKAALMARDPAINYNLKCLSKNNKEVVAQTYKISEYQNFNPDYDKWDGIVPSFIKPETSRSDYILQRQEELVKKIQMEVDIDIDKQVQWAKHMQQLLEGIQMRELQMINYGVQLEENSKKVFEVIKKMDKIYKDIQSKIKIKIQRDQLMSKFTQIMTLIKSDIKQCESVYNSMGTNIIEQIDLKQQKQVHAFKNRQQFQQSKKQLKLQKQFRIKQTQLPDIDIAITQNKLALIYISPNIIKILSAKHTLLCLNSLNLQNKIKQYLFHLYWFVCLRVMFGQKDGVNIKQYLQFRNGLTFIYNEIQGIDNINIKWKQNQLVENTVAIFSKYNEIYQVQFIPQQKKNTIYVNCQNSKQYMQQFDSMFATVLKNKQFLKVLSQPITLTSEKTQKQQQFFRNKYNLKINQIDQNSIVDLIAQNLVLIFYQFRNVKRNHDLLLKAIVEMAVQGKNTLNGKDSFYQNYYNSKQPIETFMQKIIKKISQ